MAIYWKRMATEECTDTNTQRRSNWNANHMKCIPTVRTKFNEKKNENFSRALDLKQTALMSFYPVCIQFHILRNSFVLVWYNWWCNSAHCTRTCTLFAVNQMKYNIGTRLRVFMSFMNYDLSLSVVATISRWINGSQKRMIVRHSFFRGTDNEWRHTSQFGKLHHDYMALFIGRTFFLNL